MATQKRKHFAWFIRDVCARLNAPSSGVEEWFYNPDENPMHQNQTDKYLQGRQQQLRDHIWCGLPVRALEVRPDGMSQQRMDIEEVIVRYRIRETREGCFVEFTVSPLPAGQVALYFASQSSSDAAELKKLTRGGAGRCFLDPSHWVNRLRALSWQHLSPCILSSVSEIHVNRIDDDMTPGPGEDETHAMGLKMPNCGCFTQQFIDFKAEEIGPLLNVLRSTSDAATLCLGVGDGEIGTKGVILGASTGIYNSISELVWHPPKTFPPLLEEEVSVEALTIDRPAVTTGRFVAVSSEAIAQKALHDVYGHCWIIRDENESVVGLMFDGQLPKDYATGPALNFDEQIHSIEDRYVIRIRVRPSEEARVGTHALLQRIGVIYLTPSLFPDEIHRVGQFDPLLAWLRLQTVSPSLQTWFVNNTNLKLVFTPSYIPASKLLHCQLPASFHEIKGDENHGLLKGMLSSHTVVTRFAILHLDMWTRALRGVILQDTTQYRTTWCAVLMVPLNIKLEKLNEIVREMHKERLKILALLPVGLKQRLFPLTGFPETWKTQWVEYDAAEPIMQDLSVSADDLRMVFTSWIFPELHVERGPPSWELVARGYVVQTTAAKCLFESIISALTASPLRTHFFSVVPDSKFPTCGKTCVMRRVAWDLDKQCVVLWMTKPTGFTTELVVGIRRAMQQCRKGAVIFCDFACTEELRKSTFQSVGLLSLEEKIVLVFSDSVQSVTPKAEEILVSAIWDLPELNSLGKKLNEGLLSGAHVTQTHAAVDEALRYAEKHANPVSRHFFMLALAAARGHFVPAWKWVDRARRDAKELGDALALLRVTVSEEYWKLPLNDTDQPCDLWVACQPPSCDSRRWFAFAHPFLAHLHLHLAETGMDQIQNQTINLIENLPSPNALSNLWESTTAIISSRLVDDRVKKIVQDVLQTRASGRSFSRFSEAFLVDPNAFVPCISLPGNNRLRFQEPYASVLVSRVYREARWFKRACEWAWHAQSICPVGDTSLLALTRSNAATAVAKMAVYMGDFNNAQWAYSEFQALLDENNDLLEVDPRRASEISDQISRTRVQMDILERHFPGLVSDEPGEEYIF